VSLIHNIYVFDQIMMDIRNHYSKYHIHPKNLDNLYVDLLNSWVSHDLKEKFFILKRKLQRKLSRSSSDSHSRNNNKIYEFILLYIQSKKKWTTYAVYLTNVYKQIEKINLETICIGMSFEFDLVLQKESFISELYFLPFFVPLISIVNLALFFVNLLNQIYMCRA
jgi:hypothetical protein